MSDLSVDKVFPVLGVFVTSSFNCLQKMQNSFSLKAEEFDIMNIFVSFVLLNIHRIHIMHFVQ